MVSERRGSLNPKSSEIGHFFARFSLYTYSGRWAVSGFGRGLKLPKIEDPQIKKMWGKHLDRSTRRRPCTPLGKQKLTLCARAEREGRHEIVVICGNTGKKGHEPYGVRSRLSCHRSKMSPSSRLALDTYVVHRNVFFVTSCPQVTTSYDRANGVCYFCFQST